MLLSERFHTTKTHSRHYAAGPCHRGGDSRDSGRVASRKEGDICQWDLGRAGLRLRAKQIVFRPFNGAVDIGKDIGKTERGNSIEFLQPLLRHDSVADGEQ